MGNSVVWTPTVISTARQGGQQGTNCNPGPDRRGDIRFVMSFPLIAWLTPVAPGF